MRSHPAAVVAALLLFVAAPASAQDWQADPTYGSVRLSQGFTPDPQRANITAGGSIEVAVGTCSYGYVANAPDIDLYYSTSGDSDLYVWVRSDDDTTLLINTPSGSWVCDDDGLGSLNPLVVIRNAPEGLYNLWVGTYGDGYADATIFLSEMDPR